LALGDLRGMYASARLVSFTARHTDISAGLARRHARSPSPLDLGGRRNPCVRPCRRPFCWPAPVVLSRFHVRRCSPRSPYSLRRFGGRCTLHAILSRVLAGCECCSTLCNQKVETTA